MKLTKDKYDKIAAKWKEKAYQRWPRLDIRLRFFSQFAPLFEGMDVLEIGCNAGLYVWEVAHYAKSVIGIDLSDRYMGQAQVTAQHIEKFNQNVEFLKMSTKDFCREIRKGQREAKVNAMYASFVLYHLSNKELAAVAEHILPHCSLVIIQNRTKERTNRKKGKDWREHNSQHFEKNSTVITWLEEAGFECEVHWGLEKRFADVIGRRKNEDSGDTDGDKEVEGEGSAGRDTPELGQGRPDQGSAQPAVDAAGRDGEGSPEGDDGSVLPVQEGQGDEGVCPAPGVQGVQEESPDEGLEEPSADGGGGDNPEGNKNSPRKARSPRPRKKKVGEGVGNKDGARPLS